MRLDSLPPRFVPYNRMKIRTNTLENATAIFSVNGSIPLLIGGFPPESGYHYQPTAKPVSGFH